MKLIADLRNTEAKTEKTKRDKSTIRVEDFNNPLSVIGKANCTSFSF